MNAPKKMLGSILTLALGLLAPAALAAAETGSYGYFRVVEGAATLMQAGTDERASAEINQPVLAGDRLWVPDRSRVELVLADRNILRVDGGSELILERLAASPDRDDRATVLRLLEGNLQLVVTQDSLGDELPRVETPNATVYPQDFGVYRITADRDGWSEVVVRRGSAEVVTERGSSRLRADEEATIDGDRLAEADVQEAGGFDSLERWARQLDDGFASADLDNVDDNLRYSAAPLARHGSWVYHDGSPYWRPRVAAGWRPYWQGRWIYTPSGMTWISSEPWGWVPYHYGSWDYLPAYGWVWQPGHVWSPAWVYWYWGPSYVGWCPTGYYTRFYGPRFGHGSGFRYGVYGWAGGHWGHFNHWSFVRSSYFDHGYRHGYRDGHRDGYWDGRRDVRRYAVEAGSADGRRALERGIITTDTKPLKPSTWGNPQEVQRALRVGRNGPGAAELPDVTDFIARKPDLSASVTRIVRADGNTAGLDGTPLKPSTLGRGDRGARRAEIPNAKPRNTGGNEGWSNRVGSKPAISLGDDGGDDGNNGDRSRGAGRPPTAQAKPEARAVRPAPEADGGAPRPRRTEIESSKPRREESEGRDSGEAPASRERSIRPAPEADGGSPRPDRGSRTREKPRGETRPPASDDNDGNRGDLRRYERPREEVYTKPRTSERPDSYRQPEPRVQRPTYQGPEPSRRPDPSPRYESGSESRSKPRSEASSRREDSGSRQASPQRSRGGSDHGSGSRSQGGSARQSRPRGGDGEKDRH